ncbi:MAG TPA: alpha/beta fold hydrolase [Actinomycetota bacterium]|nr:alpha/beta fold hydrolase [Actinomycetota bacterium]
MTESDNTPFASESTSFSSDGTKCAATVFRPTTSTELPIPALVMAHGFGSPRALRLYAYAERFAAAGYAAVVFDYRGFGDSDGEPRQVLDVSMQHDDWKAALEFARSLPGIDADKIVAWGTSFGGGHVLTVAGRGETLAAVIAQVPHVSGPAAVRATGFAASRKIAPYAIRDQINAVLGRKPVYIPLVGRPGDLGIMTTPDALPGLEQLIVHSGIEPDAYRQDVAARIGLKIGLYSPERVMSNIECPTLIQIASNDAITPCAVAENAAKQIPDVTVRIYECSHFDPYVDPAFTNIIADQLAFLRENVPTH